MHLLLTLLAVIAGMVILLLLAGLAMRKKHYVRCETVVNAPLPEVFGFLRLLENQDRFNKHAMAAKNRTNQYRGEDGTVGYLHSWSGDKNAGVGEKEIIAIEEGKRIETEIRFEKPMRVSASVIMEAEAISPTQTRVRWINTGYLKYPINLFIPMMQKHVRKDMEESLQTLKAILEKDR